jgi:hypothetical protein
MIHGAAPAVSRPFIVQTWHNVRVRFLVIVNGLVMLLLLCCSGDETDTSATSSTSNAQSGTGAASMGGAAPGGSSSQGGQGGAGTFACREMVQCLKGHEYCKIDQPGANGSDPVITCEPLPKECEPVIECKCLGLTGPQCMCQESAEGDLQVTCMGI